MQQIIDQLQVVLKELVVVYELVFALIASFIQTFTSL